jgi:hypothetical protein
MSSLGVTTAPFVSPYNQLLFRKSVILSWWWKKLTGSCSRSFLKWRRCMSLHWFMVGKFTLTVPRISEQSVSKSFAKHSCIPVPWWTEECQEAIWAQKRAVVFWPLLTKTNLTTFERLVRECVRLLDSLNVTHGKLSPLLGSALQLPLLYGNMYGAYQVNALDLGSSSFCEQHNGNLTARSVWRIIVLLRTYLQLCTLSIYPSLS